MNIYIYLYNLILTLEIIPSESVHWQDERGIQSPSKTTSFSLQGHDSLVLVLQLASTSGFEQVGTHAGEVYP